MRIMEGLAAENQGRRFRPSRHRNPRRQGVQDRVVMLPEALVTAEAADRRRTRVLGADLARQRPGVYMPYALEKKYPKAGTSWAWFWVFFHSRAYRKTRARASKRHHHLFDQTFQRFQARAVCAQASSSPPHPTRRHCFATHLLQSGYDIREACRNCWARREHHHDFTPMCSRWPGAVSSARWTRCETQALARHFGQKPLNGAPHWTFWLSFVGAHRAPFET